MKQAVNPYLPGYEYLPDGEPYVFGERLYIYGSHDRYNGKEFCEEDYVCWSAPVDSLGDWRYEGIIYQKKQDPRIPDAAERRMFAPDVQQGADGKYYLYYSFDFSGTIAVAVCDTPSGKYEYYGEVHYTDGTALGKGKNDRFQYDPGVLVDTTGRIFLFTGFCPQGDFRKNFNISCQMADGGMVTELEADMLTVKKAPRVVIPDAANAAGTDFEGHAFFEAPSIRKIDDIYVLIYSSENQHELCYATSNEPDGRFKYRGTIISNGDIYYKGRTEPLNYTGTNHGSIVEVLGQWYVFYHRQTNGSPYSRQGCAEKIKILEHTWIPQVAVTSCGLNKTALQGEGEYNAGIACCLLSRTGAEPYVIKSRIGCEHPYIMQEEEGEDYPYQLIANMRSGAKAGFRYFSLHNLCMIEVLTRGDGYGVMNVAFDAEDRPFVSIPVLASEDWESSSAQVCVKDGVNALWFCFEGKGAVEFKSFTLYKNGKEKK